MSAIDTDPFLLENGLLLVFVKRQRMANFGRYRMGLVKVQCRCTAQLFKDRCERCLAVGITEHDAG
jgi:hypothetical protein